MISQLLVVLCAALASGQQVGTQQAEGRCQLPTTGQMDGSLGI